MHIQSTDVASVIFSIYAEYENVFFEVEVKCLFAHEKHNHVIDTNNENSLYKFLYNLSNKELQVLGNYLNILSITSILRYSELTAA